MDRQVLEADLLVAGGGMAGVCAAIAAARQGIKVILVQDRSVLGGNASSEVRMHIVGADCHGSRRGMRESGLLEELRLEDSARNPAGSHPLWDLLLYEKVLAEPNITLLLDTAVTGVEMAGGGPAGDRIPRPQRTDRLYEFTGQPGRIQSALAIRQITQDQFVLRARFYADCTGDGRLGFEAGADFRIGRESRSMHQESLAPETDDRYTMGSSILFTSHKTDRPVPFVPPPWARRFTDADLGVGRSISSWEYGYWWVEWGGMHDVIKDHTTRIRHELYRIALGIWDYVKNSGRYPDSANWVLDWIGPIPGKRESRRFLGPHILTQNDVQESRVFDDEVAYGGWPIDLHPPQAMDQLTLPPYQSHPLAKCYGIPLRCYFSRNIENLFLAGRIISASHVAFGSSRVMGTCAAGGEAVGFAAAYCIRHGITPAELVAAKNHIFELKQEMLQQDVTLLNTWPDPARSRSHSAKVTASSCAAGSAAENLVDGWTRDELDPRTGQLVKSHAWHSGPLRSGLSQWVQFDWRQPVQIREIHLWFDSGFSRQLTLSQSQSTNRSILRGPQPETVKDYRIEIDGRPVISQTGNYQRKRVHVLANPVSARSMRLEVLGTNGVPEARVFEVRVY